MEIKQVFDSTSRLVQQFKLRIFLYYFQVATILQTKVFLCSISFDLENMLIFCRFARLQSVKGVVAGRLLFIRFVATTGDAMGMNMVSKVNCFNLTGTADNRYHEVKFFLEY